MSDAVAALLATRSAKHQGDLVFTYKGRPIDKDYVEHLLKKCVCAASLDRRLHSHSLRQTHATLLVQAGVPIYAVSKLLGHASVRITERYYARLSPENLHEEVNRPNLSFTLN